MNLEKSKPELKRLYSLMRDMKSKFLKSITPKEKNESKSNSNEIPKEVIDFMTLEHNQFVMFIHFTRTRKVADNILTGGFMYHDGLYTTAQEIVPDRIVIDYKTSLYRDYGEYMIVLAIPRMLYDRLVKNVNTLKDLVLVEHLVSSEIISDEFSHRLPPVFVKGFVNMRNFKIYPNKLFLHEYIEEDFVNQSLKKMERN
ncbi:MAG: hypothetical protein MI922_20740 [Bacteroidales bacterium]|nr:hypothetical protein [Bacteroidales bacterium]